MVNELMSFTLIVEWVIISDQVLLYVIADIIGSGVLTNIWVQVCVGSQVNSD